MSFKRALGPFDATMVVIGGIIGSGVFINPYIVARHLDTPLLVLGAWAAGGVIALAGAFSYAELGSVFSDAGGQYVYLRDGLHPLAGFLYGWALLLVIESGAIAAVAITFATYALHVVGGPDGARVPLAIAALIVLSIVNYLGVKPGSRVLNVFVVLKVAALAVLVGAGAFAASHPAWFTLGRATASGGSTAIAFGAALVPILFTYGGWQTVTYIGEEIKNPNRNLPLAIIAGTIAVVAIYMTVNVVYLRALGLEGLANTTAPAADAARRMFGSSGDLFVSAAIAISTFGFLDLSILAPTRVYYAMAADRLFVPALARLHPRFRTPSLAIIVQLTWSCILALTGTYEQLLDYVVFADWIFFGLTVATVLTFRRSYPLERRPAGAFQAPGYPYVQIAFSTIAAAVVLSVILGAPSAAAKGAILIALGIPVYFWYAKEANLKSPGSPIATSGSGQAESIKR